MIGTSLRMGAIVVVIAYAISIPVVTLMARYKGEMPDKTGVTIVTVLISVSSLTFVHFFRFIGNSWSSLPNSFPALSAQDIRSYTLPTVILELLSISGVII